MRQCTAGNFILSYRLPDKCIIQAEVKTIQKASKTILLTALKALNSNQIVSKITMYCFQMLQSLGANRIWRVKRYLNITVNEIADLLVRGGSAIFSCNSKSVQLSIGVLI